MALDVKDGSKYLQTKVREDGGFKETNKLVKVYQEFYVYVLILQ